ncbi:predicted protein [Histoplasma capsulatum H143]|uniref:Uncharacterized protein n=1 Tax=Ajellomyces capsulatus (strain H143) TaxID=544712 RepID=C6HB77_AJECH|nr:predicted protein [Histoplasma capsulatum H143]
MRRRGLVGNSERLVLRKPPFHSQRSSPSLVRLRAEQGGKLLRRGAFDVEATVGVIGDWNPAQRRHGEEHANSKIPCFSTQTGNDEESKSIESVLLLPVRSTVDLAFGSIVVILIQPSRDLILFKLCIPFVAKIKPTSYLPRLPGKISTPLQPASRNHFIQFKH